MGLFSNLDISFYYLVIRNWNGKRRIRRLLRVARRVRAGPPVIHYSATVGGRNTALPQYEPLPYLLSRKIYVNISTVIVRFPSQSAVGPLECTTTPLDLFLCLLSSLGSSCDQVVGLKPLPIILAPP